LYHRISSGLLLNTVKRITPGKGQFIWTSGFRGDQSD